MSTQFLSPGQVIEPAPAPAAEEGWHDNMTVELMCPDCREWPPHIIDDFTSGETVCTSCGLVLGDRIIDTRSEWRTFANEESGNDDPSRVGAAANPLLNGAQLETSISFGEGHNSRELNRAHARMAQDKSAKSLKEAYQKINALCQPLHLPSTVMDTACHLYKMTDDHKAFKGKNVDSLIAGCLFIACRQMNVPRTFREINHATHVSKKEVGRIFKHLEKFFHANKASKNVAAASSGKLPTGSQSASENTLTYDLLGVTQAITESYEDKASTRASELCDRYCSLLALSRSAVMASKSIADNMVSKGVLAGRSPLSAAAACIYMASHLMGVPKSPKEIAAVAGVSDGTIRTSYRLLYVKKEELIDDDWLKEGKGDLKRLPAV